MEECPEIGPICAERDEPPQQHDQTIWLSELRFMAEYAFSDALSASAVLPLRWVDNRIVFRDLSGREIQLDYQNIHHRNEALLGIADPLLLGRLDLHQSEWRYGFRLGSTLPIGTTEPDPFRLAEDGRSHQHFQFGTGTFLPTVGFEVDRSGRPLGLGAWGVALLSLYENRHGYQAGHRLALGLGATSRLGLERWSFRLGVEAQGELPERWSGTIHPSDGNQGRIDVLAAGAASWRLADGWSLTTALKVPFVTYVVGGQLDYPAFLEVGLTRVLDLRKSARNREGRAASEN